MWTRIKQSLGGYIFNILLDLDEDANVFFIGIIVVILKVLNHKTVPAAGNAHYTISQTVAEMRTNGSKVGCVACDVLTKIWSLWIKTLNYDHCTDAMSNVPWDESEG